MTDPAVDHELATAGPDDPIVAPGAPRPSSTRTVPLWAAALLVGVFLLTTVVFGILAVGYKSDLDEAGDKRAEVASTAGELMHAVLAFDYRDPEGSVAAVLENASGQFADDFERISTEITEQFAALEAVPEAVIRDVFVSDVSAEGTAVAIVFYDQVIDGAAGTSARTDCYARLQLAEGPGGWTVNTVQDLAGCGRTEIDGPADTASTTTSLPG